MKKNILATLIFIICILVIMFFKEHIMTVLNGKQKPRYGIQKTEYTKKLDGLSVDGYIPLVTNVSPIINTKIQDTVNKLVLEKSNESSANIAAQKKMGITSDTLGTLSLEVIEPEEFHPDIISFLVRVTGFTGGAHGFLYYIPFNFDSVTGAQLSRDDTLQKLAIKIDTLSSVARTALRTEMQHKLSRYNEELMNEAGEEGLTKNKDGEIKIDETMFNDGTETKATNYQNLLIGKSSLKIYFEPYAVASWAEGEFIINLPFSNFPRN